MAAPKLIVNGLDLSSYLMVQHEEGMDPAAPGYWAAQFAGTPAFGEGKRKVAETADNREPIFPLLLEGSSRAALHKLVAEIDARLVRNALIEFASDAGDSSTYFTLEGGHLDVKYEYFLTGVALTTRATLHLSTRPFAHTGTTRLVASIPQGSSAVVEFPASGVLGDTDALANLEVQVGSAVASVGRVVMWGFHPHPSHNPYRPATSGRAQGGATVRGASGAIGSQYTAIPVSPTAASGIAYQEYLDPAAAHVGRHRVFGVARSGLSRPISVYALDRFGALLGATAVVTQTDQSKWQLVDFGEVQVPARATGQEAVPTQYVQLLGGGASGASVVASPALHLNGLLFLPLDYGAGVMRTAGGGAAELIGDGFTGFSIFGNQMNSGRVGDLGGIWTKIAGQFEGFSYENSGWITPVQGESGVANASAFYAIGSGRQSGDVFVETGFNVSGEASLIGATDAHLAVYPKMTPSGPYVKALFGFGPSPYLSIISGASPGAKNIRASAGMPSIGASGIFQGQYHKISVRVLSGRMDVWVATGALAPSPVISASHAEIGLTGYPGIDAKQGPNGVAAGVQINIRRFSAYAFGGTAVDIGPREYFRFESYPEGRVVQGNASVFVQDRLADYRGGFPKLSPVGSGAESPGPARVVVFQGEIDNVVGNDGPNVALGALERFKFLV